MGITSRWADVDQVTLACAASAAEPGNKKLVVTTRRHAHTHTLTERERERERGASNHTDTID